MPVWSRLTGSAPSSSFGSKSHSGSSATVTTSGCRLLPFHRVTLWPHMAVSTHAYRKTVSTAKMTATTIVIGASKAPQRGWWGLQRGYAQAPEASTQARSGRYEAVPWWKAGPLTNGVRLTVSAHCAGGRHIECSPPTIGAEPRSSSDKLLACRRQRF